MAPAPIRALNQLSGGWEPSPLASIARRPDYPWIVVGTTCIGAFIGQLDASIVQLTLPTLEHSFDARLDAVGWVAIGYLVAFAAALPIFARLAEMFGRKLLYLAGFVVFTVSSVLCGFAPSLGMLILFRVLQGIGGAMLGANSVVILVRAAGPGRQGRAMGIFATAQAIGVSVGPVVGGILLYSLDWRWVFWVNVPFGLAGAIIGWLVLPKTSDAVTDKRFDWLGAILLAPVLSLLLIVLSESGTWGLASPAFLLSLLSGLSLLLLFIWRERRAPSPLIDLRLFGVGAFSGGVVGVMSSYAMLYGMFFLMAFDFVRGYHDGNLVAGLHLAVIPVALGILAPFSGALYERIGPRMVCVAGMITCLFGLVVLSHALADKSADVLWVMIALAIFGAGLGIFIAPNNSATMSAAPRERSGEAGGLLNLTRVIGCSVGVAAASSALSWRVAVVTGGEPHTEDISAYALRDAVNGVLWLLAAFAVVAAAASLVRSEEKPG